MKIFCNVWHLEGIGNEGKQKMKKKQSKNHYVKVVFLETSLSPEMTMLCYPKMKINIFEIIVNTFAVIF